MLSLTGKMKNYKMCLYKDAFHDLFLIFFLRSFFLGYLYINPHYLTETSKVYEKIKSFSHYLVFRNFFFFSFYFLKR